MTTNERPFKDKEAFDLAKQTILFQIKKFSLKAIANTYLHKYEIPDFSEKSGI
ncbi:MAG: hypothetical protein RMX97_25375 [Nostoc sp. DedQUE11]|nr:hypothetical protein [Nostoc sp. DedQUE11]